MIYRLIILNGPSKGQHVTVEDEPMLIGRGEPCTLRLDDAEVALKHAVIEHRPDGLSIRDLGSMNKILVNRREVSESRLKHGDTIEVGRTRLLVQARVQAEIEDARRRARRTLARVAWAAVWIVVFGGAGAAFFWWGGGVPPEAPPRPEPANAARVPVVAVPTVTVATPVPAPTPAPPPATNAAPPLPRPVPTPDPPPRPDPLQQRIGGMMTEALRSISNNMLPQADQLLSSIELIAPDFLPAIERRADLVERQGRLDDAMDQWKRLGEASKDPSVRRKAQTQLDRLSAATRVPTPPFSGQVKLVSAEQSKYPPQDADFDEMRLLRIRLAPATGDQALDADAVRVDVTFYDRDRVTGETRPTTANVPDGMLTPSGPWRPGEERLLTATYVVPKGSRPGPDPEVTYFGYRIRVFYHGALQLENARPTYLLNAAGAVGRVESAALATDERAEAPPGAVAPETPHGKK